MRWTWAIAAQWVQVARQAAGDHGRTQALETGQQKSWPMVKYQDKFVDTTLSSTRTAEAQLVYNTSDLPSRDHVAPLASLVGLQFCQTELAYIDTSKFKDTPR